jgi:hypothetical protein
VISVVCFLWDGPREFLPAYVNVLERMVAHHLPEPHRFICLTAGTTQGFSEDVEVLALPRAAQPLLSIPSPEGPRFPSSYPRLWTFSDTAASVLGERVLLLDVDCLVAGRMSPLFVPPFDFVGWRSRPPQVGPRRFGGGTWLLRTGTRSFVWDEFVRNPAACIQRARDAGYRGSDQAWISYCLSEREYAWPEPSGIYCVQDYRTRPAPRPRHRRRGAVLPPAQRTLVAPPDAVILHMNGHDKPWTSADPLVMTHWWPFFRPEDAACLV